MFGNSSCRVLCAESWKRNITVHHFTQQSHRVVTSLLPWQVLHRHLCFLYTCPSTCWRWRHWCKQQHSRDQMVDVETVMTGLLDEIPALRHRRMPLLITLSIIFFLLGLPQVCQVFPEQAPRDITPFTAVVKLEHLPCFEALHKRIYACVLCACKVQRSHV